MSFNEKEVAITFEFDNDKLEEIKKKWLEIVKLLMWGNVSSKKIGALPRSRKRVLEVGESFGSFISSKAWIDQPRQQLKSALGSSVKLRDSLTALSLVNKHITEGDDAETYQKQVVEIEMLLMALIYKHENLWANLLESQSYDDE